MPNSVKMNKGLGTVYNQKPNFDVFQPIDDKLIDWIWKKADDKTSWIGDIGRGLGGTVGFLGKQTIKIVPFAGHGVEAIGFGMDQKLANNIDGATHLRCTCGFCEAVLATGLRKKTLSVVNASIAVRAGKGFFRGLPGIGHVMEGIEKGADVFGKLTDKEEKAVIQRSSVMLWLGGKSGCQSAQGITTALVGQSNLEKVLCKFFGVFQISREMQD